MKLKDDFKIAITSIGVGRLPFMSSVHMARGVNTFMLDLESAIKHINSKDAETRATFSKICLKWIIKLDYMTKMSRFDQRNQASCTLSYNLVARGYFGGFNLKELVDGYSGRVPIAEQMLREQLDTLIDADRRSLDPSVTKQITFTNLFVESMSQEHRTLQQTFTSLVFNWLYYGDVGRDYLNAQSSLKRLVKPQDLHFPVI